MFKDSFMLGFMGGSYRSDLEGLCEGDRHAGGVKFRSVGV